MRHLVWAVVMVLAGLGITMGTANVLQSAAIARASMSSSEPFVIETAKSQTKPSPAAKERVAGGRSRESFPRTVSLAGL